MRMHVKVLSGQRCRGVSSWRVLSARYRHCRNPQKAETAHLSATYKTSSNNAISNLVEQYTVLSSSHMTPEIPLHLITKDCTLWKIRINDTMPFPDPFWAFYWPGGQVLTRYILDHGDAFHGETILDVGSGCGASAIACAKVGAKTVIANDVDPYAACAIKMNASVNRVNIQVDCRNLIGQLNPDWSTILLGDMFYDCDFRDSLIDWLTEQMVRYKSQVLIGDPGRLPLMESSLLDKLTKMAEYDLPESCAEENNGLTKGYVWKLKVS